MAKVTVSIPQGTRDFGPETVRKRNYIFNTIRSVFEVYGFQPLETPAMENLDTLMGKYGEEGDRLIFKILNNGLDNTDKQKQVKEDFEKVLQGKSVKGITERALKYDLTIPFARYVAMNQGQLTFPFRRYQIQPVWRADRPQKGRYREFYQCDADVVGSNSLLNEIELANIYATVFEKLGVDVEIKINSRKILAALAEICGGADKMTDITIAIDKLDKIGLEKVKEELSQRGLNNDQITIIEKYLSITGSNAEKIIAVKKLLGNSEMGKKGIEEIEYLIADAGLVTHNSRLVTDLTLARGLNYYTGIIFEVKAQNVQMGSIGGGGRYDDLTGLFGVPNIPGVGISFGVDRIYDVMEELKLFPADVHTGTQVLFFNLGETESKAAFTVMQQLRNSNIRCELYHEPAKFDKQFKYAEKKNIPYTAIIGSKEIEEKTCIVKDLRNSHQQTLSINKLADFSFM
jgi:histidyl-tRNA synthetase